MSVFLTIFSIVATLVVAEILLRIKNSDGTNYHIEMWKYSRDLKKTSDNPVLGHEHIPNSEAVLQNVKIRINEKGMRGPSIPPQKKGQRRILLIGSSATFGWGVKEESTMAAVLQKMFDAKKKNAIVMNAGIGNYNTKRYVELTLSKYTDVMPSDIVVNYYLNDAEILNQDGGNILIRNSELAVTFWILANRILGKFGSRSLYDHYRDIYNNSYPGFIDMNASLKRLADYAQTHNIRLYLMMMPEVHDLTDYRYGFSHEIMADIAAKYGFIYIDALPALKKVADAESLWAMPGDPHPNAKAHRIFAEVLFPELAKQ